MSGILPSVKTKNKCRASASSQYAFVSCEVIIYHVQPYGCRRYGKPRFLSDQEIKMLRINI